MATTSEFTGDGRGVRLVASGTLTGAEIIALKAGLEADPDTVRRLAYWLVDLRGVTEMRVTPQEVRDLVEVDRRLAGLCPGAAVAVVGPTDVAFGMARMWEILAEGIGWPTGVFRDLADAELWIAARLARNPDSPRPG